MPKPKVQSVEPNVKDFVNASLRDYGVDYKPEQEHLNTDIDRTLAEYSSKGGGRGGNRPDAKALIQSRSSLEYYPVLIEYKGYEWALEKLDNEGQVDNRTNKNEPNFKNIEAYAVNGAVHYANAILHYTTYSEVIAIGVTGHKDSQGLSLIHI